MHRFRIETGDTSVVIESPQTREELLTCYEKAKEQLPSEFHPHNLSRFFITQRQYLQMLVLVPDFAGGDEVETDEDKWEGVWGEALDAYIDEWDWPETAMLDYLISVLRLGGADVKEVKPPPLLLELPSNGDRYSDLRE